MSSTPRQCVLDALARRAAQQPAGPLRELLLAKRAALAARALPPAFPDLPDRPDRQTTPPVAGPLADLVARVAELRPTPAAPLPGEQQRQRREWNALRLERRLAEPMKRVAPPEQTGPLNTQALVPRALQQLHALSPDYLQRLLEQVDTLARLAPLAPLTAAGDAKRPPGSASPRRPRQRAG